MGIYRLWTPLKECFFALFMGWSSQRISLSLLSWKFCLSCFWDWPLALFLSWLFLDIFGWVVFEVVLYVFTFYFMVRFLLYTVNLGCAPYSFLKLFPCFCAGYHLFCNSLGWCLELTAHAWKSLTLSLHRPCNICFWRLISTIFMISFFLFFFFITL